MNPARRRLAVLAVIVAATALAPPALARGPRCAAAHTPIARAAHATLQRSVVCLVDQQRRRRGLPPLIENAHLNRSAQGWSDTMVAARMFSHGADFGGRITAAGFHWSSAGENIATGYPTAAAVVAAWMDSAGHCANILSPTYRYVGTGVSGHGITGFSSQGGTWTQDFGLRIGQRAPSHDWGPAHDCPYRSG